MTPIGGVRANFCSTLTFLHHLVKEGKQQISLMYCKRFLYLIYLLHEKLCYQQISIDSSDTLAAINRIIE